MGLYELKDIIERLKLYEQEHWAIKLAIEYLEDAYQELRDVGV